jgi:hypothetical protein
MTTSFGNPSTNLWDSGGWTTPTRTTWASPTLSFTDNPFIDFLEEEPDIAFQGALARGNLTPNQYQTFRNQRNTIYGQYQAKLMEQMQKGIMPTERFTDFIGNFDFGKEFQRFGPRQRTGGSIGRFAPPVRYERRA